MSRSLKHKHRPDRRALLPLTDDLDGAPRRPVRQAPPLKPKTSTQARYLAAIGASTLTFGIGPAGTGKTYLAARFAAQQLIAGKVERIIVTRPAVEAGESLGFLPGELEEKYEPYFRPVKDALEEGLGSGHLEYLIKSKGIEAIPLAYIRGMTLKNAVVIADEMQNVTPVQMKLFLTRIGEEATIIVNGDIDQQDIPGLSGLKDVLDRGIQRLNGVSVVEFGVADIVRSGLCQEVVQLYSSRKDTDSASSSRDARYNESIEDDNEAGLRRVLRAA